MKDRIYIAGPMRGHYLYNVEAFEDAHAKLTVLGWHPISPIDLDYDAGLPAPRDMPVDWDWDKLPPGVSIDDIFTRDMEALQNCDAIYMLKGWQDSRGAALEYHAAKMLGLGIHFEDNSSATKTDKPTDTAEQRKRRPVASGVLDYFPDAIMAIANCSWVGNEQHNPGEPLHWSRHKSNDHADCMMRHFMERGQVDSDGIRHSTKAAWRALALLQLEIEAERD